MVNTSKHEKEGLVGYIDRLKQERIVVKNYIGENFLDDFVQTYK